MDKQERKKWISYGRYVQEHGDDGVEATVGFCWQREPANAELAERMSKQVADDHNRVLMLEAQVTTLVKAVGHMLASVRSPHTSDKGDFLVLPREELYDVTEAWVLAWAYLPTWAIKVDSLSTRGVGSNGVD